MHKPPDSRPVAGPNTYVEFNHLVGLDLWFEDRTGPVLSMYDRGKGWLELCELPDKRAESMMRAF